MNGLVSKMSKYTKICHHKLPEPKMSSENCFFCPVECLKFKGNQFRIIQKREAVTLRAKEAGPNCRRISGGRFIRNQQQERANATDQHWGRAEDRTQTQTGLRKMRRRWREAETHRWGEGCDETREEIRDHEADAGQVWRGAQGNRETPETPVCRENHTISPDATEDFTFRSCFMDGSFPHVWSIILCRHDECSVN